MVRGTAWRRSGRTCVGVINGRRNGELGFGGGSAKRRAPSSAKTCTAWSHRAKGGPLLSPLKLCLTHRKAPRNAMLTPSLPAKRARSSSVTGDIQRNTKQLQRWVRCKSRPTILQGRRSDLVNINHRTGMHSAPPPQLRCVCTCTPLRTCCHIATYKFQVTVVPNLNEKPVNRNVRSPLLPPFPEAVASAASLLYSKPPTLFDARG